MIAANDKAIKPNLHINTRADWACLEKMDTHSGGFAVV
jgi:hypothetical protein